MKMKTYFRLIIAGMNLLRIELRDRIRVGRALVAFLCCLSAARGSDIDSVLNFVGAWPEFPRGPALDVTVSGNYVYVAAEVGGLQVIDVSDPAHPRQVGGAYTSYCNGSAAWANGVEVSGSYAFVSVGLYGLDVFDISNPTKPRRVGGYAGYTADGLAVSGNHVYLAARDLKVIDISDPTRPQVVGGCDTGAYGARDVTVCGNFAYVAADEGGLQVIDVSDPANPQRIGGWPLPRGSAWSVAVSGNYAYIPDDISGLHVIDVSNPRNPARVGGVTLGCCPYKIVVSGSIAYVVAHESGLHVIDISSPINPQRIGGYVDTTLPASHRDLAWSVAVSGNTAYVGIGWAAFQSGLGGGRLQVIDVSDLQRPQCVGTYDNIGSASAVAIRGNFAYVADGRAGFEVLNLSDPATPHRVSRFPANLYASSVALSGNYAFVGDAGTGLEVIDISNPESPARVGGFPMGGLAQEVVISGNVAFVAGDLGLWCASGPGCGSVMLDISDPRNPKEISRDCSGDANAVAVEGNYAYWAGGDAQGLTIMDWSVANSPRHVGTYKPPGGEILGVAISRNFAYLAGTFGLQVIDVSNPASPKLLGSYGVNRYASSVAVNGDYAFVLFSATGLEMIDISDPTNPQSLPQSLGQYHINGLNADYGGLAVQGDRICVAAGPHGLLLLEVSRLPVFLQQPESSTLCGLSSGGASVSVFSREPVTYQWYRGQSGDTSHPIIGAVSRDLRLPLVHETAFYWVRVSNASGTTDSQSATIRVAAPIQVHQLGAYQSFAAGGEYRGLSVVSNYVYVATASAGLQVLDMSKPLQPVAVSVLDVGPASGIDVVGRYAYVATRGAWWSDGGLVIVDVKNPAQPSQVGWYGARGNAYDVLVMNRCAYVADDVGLQILDVSDPTDPALVSSYDLGCPVHHVRVLGGYAYLAVNSTGLHILDVNDPSNPRGMGIYNCGGITEDAGVVEHLFGRYAFVLGSEISWLGEAVGYLDVIDVSNPSSPVFLGYYLTSGTLSALELSGTKAILVGTDEGRGFVEVLDLSIASKPTLLSGYLSAGEPLDVQMVGEDAYVADGSAGLSVVNISDPTDPSLRSRFRPGAARDVREVGGLAYVVNGPDGLRIFDVGAALHPVFVGANAGFGDAQAIDVVGVNAYVAAGSSGLQVVDVRNPAMPVVVGSWAGGGQAMDVRVVDNYAYVADGPAGLELIELSNPASPRRVGAYDSAGTAIGVTLVGSQAYLADGEAGLAVIDVSTPSNPVRIGSCDTDGTARSVRVSGGYAYVADGDGGLVVIDVTNPGSPQKVAVFSTSGPALDLEVLENVVYVMVGGNGVEVVDVSTPALPMWVGGYDTPGEALGVCGHDRMLYIADGSWGLTIVEATPVLQVSAPVLSGQAMALYWIAGSEIRLQKTSSLSHPDWHDVTGSVGTNTVTLPPTESAAFFRLVKP